MDASALAFLLSQSLATKEQEEQVKREEEAKKARSAWRQRRRQVKDEFLALLDNLGRSPLHEMRLGELADLALAMDASKPGSSSASSVARKKEKRSRRRTRRTRSRSWRP